MLEWRFLTLRKIYDSDDLLTLWWAGNISIEAQSLYIVMALATRPSQALNASSKLLTSNDADKEAGDAS